MSNNIIKPDYIFETSWEICNKVGGIYTVLSTKAKTITEDYGDNYILIGPDVWMETSEHPDFIEDFEMLSEWREKAAEEGLSIRLGRWNVSGFPLVILVDFKPLFSEKDSIFYELWEHFKLDSLSGQWDYIEPAMFGFAAARVIESFYEFNLSATDRIVAHFHEWMTGTGILYLKKHVAQVATVFTSHATVLGRSIAGNGLPLYGSMEQYKPEETARNFGVLSKQSLESLSAREADSFTTVSEITARECRHFLAKNPDVITVNGFEDTFVPAKEDFQQKRNAARQKLLSVASAVTGQQVADDSLLVINSGRYEFLNKGMDLFIDALAELNKDTRLKRKLVAFITVPANHAGPRQDVLKRMDDLSSAPVEKPWLSHYLFDEDKDPTIRRLREKGLMNEAGSKVSVIFVPAYLDGRDGIFNLPYYDALIGFDVSVFPSYYEPWGYTPLESIAFSIPTITTSLAGFGSWVNEYHDVKHQGVIVSERSDANEEEVVKDIYTTLASFLEMKGEEYDRSAGEAYNISRDALWQSFIDNYREAWSVALAKVGARKEMFSGKQQSKLREYIPATGRDAEPKWKKILVKAEIPKKLKGLNELSKNIWWSWNCEAEGLFSYMNRDKWEETGHNPIALLEAIPMERYKELEKDKEFMDRLDSVMTEFRAYMDAGPADDAPLISYFSMEYGLHGSLKIYSGGLGILAGDYLKQASDDRLNMIGVGLMYRYGYFNQKLAPHGEQIAEYMPQRFSYLPINPVRDAEGNWVKINIALPGRSLTAKAWELNVGHVKLYLLDTDISDNQEKDRSITHQLYGGNNEHRLKQELLLGVGGIRLLETMGIKPRVYHCNEGHAAFIGIERIRRLIENRIITFPMAKEIVRSSTLFTTHTPVPAGHDAFSEDLLRTYIPHYPGRLNISWDEFMHLGRANPQSQSGPFSMSVLALNLSQEVNGVSRIHGEESRKMFSIMFPGYFPEEINIGHITNGVHYGTWTSRIWRRLYSDTFGSGFHQHQSDPAYWEKVHEIPDKVIWNVRKELKSELFDFLKKRVREDMTRRQEAPQVIINTIDKLDEKALTVGFARRFATYKRAQLLFKNEAQLARLVNDPDHPVQFIFAGKAHPNDKAGQDLIRHIIETSRKPEFQGRIIFLENYDMHVARKLVQGVDVWLNTPTRPLEASGTSGMKALMNGVLNFSVMDGWWAEGYRENAGWAIPEQRTYDNQQFQDELDAETIYNIFEDEIIPAFYNRPEHDIPAQWARFIKNSIAGICSEFTMKRMVDEYVNKYYNKLAVRAVDIKADHCAMALEISEWKARVRDHWHEIVVKSVKVPDASKRPLHFGEGFKAEVKIDCGSLSPEDMALEVVFGQQAKLGQQDVLFLENLAFKGTDKDGISTFYGDFEIDHAGSLDYAIRIYPTHPMLASKQESGLLRYI